MFSVRNNCMHSFNQLNYCGMLIQSQDIKNLNIALEAMRKSDELWARYFESLMVSKFSLRKDSPQSIQVLSNLFNELRTLEISRRVIELHAYIRCCGLDSKLLAVLRFVDTMQSRPMSKDKTSIVPYFHGDNKLESLCVLMIESLYETVLEVCQEETDVSQRSSVLGKMSSYYHAMVSWSRSMKCIILLLFSGTSPCYEEYVLDCVWKRKKKAKCASCHVPCV